MITIELFCERIYRLKVISQIVKTSKLTFLRNELTELKNLGPKLFHPKSQYIEAMHMILLEKYAVFVYVCVCPFKYVYVHICVIHSFQYLS